ncbi:MAG TPA: MotA/TolQ/ExbB proton channel family protein [Ruminiclostridium sp.]|nr:MotA/TolQ/ExbB proton channel family protein [Ruminiclostridium sp.]
MSFIMGLVLCAAAVVAVVSGGGDPAKLIDFKALVFVAIGITGLILITSPMTSFLRDIGCAFAALKKPEKPQKLTKKIMNLVQTARHEGILALEGLESEIKDPILKKGIAMITGSADRETIESILKSDAEFYAEKEKSAQEFIERIAMMSPGIGMLGTLVEIVQMLYTYKGPQTLAPGIAKALLPVVYSGIIAYLLLMPLAARVKSGSEQRKQQRELAIQGVLAIQSGEPPHIVEQRLSRFNRGTKENGGNSP